MWLATQHGFFSIVAHREDKNVFLVRARVKNDLENVVRLFESLYTKRHLDDRRFLIHEDALADYRFRMFITGRELYELMRLFVYRLDYPDFKSRIKETEDQVDKIEIYSKTWSMFNEYQYEKLEQERVDFVDSEYETRRAEAIHDLQQDR